MLLSSLQCSEATASCAPQQLSDFYLQLGGFFRLRSFSLPSALSLCVVSMLILSPGGHTSEALQLLSALDLKRYTPRRYIINNGDYLSIQKAEAFERANSSSHMVGASRLSISLF